MSATTERRALVSGASIAGPALAYWLTQNGWSVTLVERASQIRGGGYPIDVRGTAVEVVKRMGIYEDVRAHQVGRRATQILDQKGRMIAEIDLSADLLNNEAKGDVELPRGDLASILHDLTRDAVDYAFDESVETLDQQSDYVDVAFRSGRTDRFDIVVGADGIHSTTRRLVFGPEQDYIHHLGPVVAIWDTADAGPAPGTGTMYNLPGRVAMHFRENLGPARGFVAFVSDDPAGVDVNDPTSAAALAEAAFADHLIPHVQILLAGLAAADDIFYDTVSQIRMDTWHRGRVALVGDSAYAPSFLSGQGTSMALIGAHVLASELVSRSEPEAAFEAYENKVRDFMIRNQAIALRTNTNALPRTNNALVKRNVKLRTLPFLKRSGLLKLLDRGYRETPASLSIDGYGLGADAVPVRGNP